MKTLKNLLEKLNACEDAINWAGNKNIGEVIAQAERGDWLLWLAKRIKIDIRPLTLAKALCAKTVIHLMEDKRSKDAVNLAERFGTDLTITEEDLKNAAAAAAAADAAAYAAAYAAYVAADAAAADAADAAAYAAADAAAARIKNQLETANICREYLTTAVFKQLGIV